jgi:hypothetical protein
MKGIVIVLLCLAALLVVGVGDVQAGDRGNDVGALLRQLGVGQVNRRGSFRFRALRRQRLDLQSLLLELQQGQHHCHCNDAGSANLLGLLINQQQGHCHHGGGNAAALLQLLGLRPRVGY